MVKGQRARLEVVGSNPHERIFYLILEALGTGYFTRYQRLEPSVPLSGYRFKKPVPKGNLNRRFELLVCSTFFLPCDRHFYLSLL